MARSGSRPRGRPVCVCANSSDADCTQLRDDTTIGRLTPPSTIQIVGILLVVCAGTAAQRDGRHHHTTQPRTLGSTSSASSGELRVRPPDDDQPGKTVGIRPLERDSRVAALYSAEVFRRIHRSIAAVSTRTAQICAVTLPEARPVGSSFPAGPERPRIRRSLCLRRGSSQRKAGRVPYPTRLPDRAAWRDRRYGFP